MTLESLKRYRPAMLATQYIQQKNPVAAAGALEKLVGTLDLGEDGPKFVNAVRSDEKGNSLLAQFYAGEYQKLLMKSKIKDLFNFYSDSFKKRLDDESYKIAESYFAEHGDSTYESIYNKIKTVEGTLKSGRTDIKEEERKELESEMDKYQKIMYPLQGFEELELKKLGNPIEENSFDKSISEMFKPKPKGEK